MYIEENTEVNKTEQSAEEIAEREENAAPETFSPDSLHYEHDTEKSSPVPESDLSIENGKPQVSMIAVGIRAAFLTVVAVIFLFGCYISFFPYSAMKMYSALDMKHMALVSAERYMNRHSAELDLNADTTVVPAPFGKYADALYCAVNNSVYLMNESASENGYDSDDTLYYAQKVEKYANLFIGLSGNTDSLYERVKKIDEYSLYNSAPALHPYVYSYVDKLQSDYFKAQFILGKTDLMQISAEAVTTRWRQEDWVLTDSSSVSDVEIKGYFVFLSQLTTYINAELEKLGLARYIGANLTVNNVPESVILYGNSKPFDLFVYDGNDYYESDNGEIKIPRGDGAFTFLYDDLVNTFSKFGDYLKSKDRVYAKYLLDDSGKYGAENPYKDQDEHLKYTYYTKIFSEYILAMNNMTAVLSANRQYFDEDYRTNLQNAHAGVWQNNLFTDYVYIYVGDTQKWQLMGSCLWSEWYMYGWLTDYVAF